MKRQIGCLLMATALVRGSLTAGTSPHFVAVEVDPPKVLLLGPVARYSLLVTGTTPDGRRVDLTGKARFRSDAPDVASVDDLGVVRPVVDGSSSIVVEVAGHELAVPVDVSGSHEVHHFSFTGDVMPLLDRYGCNSAGCHGKAEGQGGLKLSVFNSDPGLDYEQITVHARGRRVVPAAPDRSLILLKATNTWAHGGGARIERDSHDYAILREWIAAGVPYGESTAARVVRVTVYPKSRIIGPGGEQRLRVVARYSDGRTRDVTHLARYTSNREPLAAVDRNGLVTIQDRPGQAVVMVSFMNRFDVFRVLIPRSREIAGDPQFAENNFIDRFVHDRLRALNIVPSELSDDAEYLRRVFLDVIGTLPTADEVRRFLKDRRPDRRSRIVEALLERPEFADYWALKWSDTLRVERHVLGHKGAYKFYRWIRESIAANRPYDRFVRDVLTVRGVLADFPQGYFYKVVSGPGKIASEFSQIFLGLRIACAECHHHPTDVWSQRDYYGMQAFFTQVKFKKTLRGEAIYTTGDPQTRHPRTGELIFPHPLGATISTEGSPGGPPENLAPPGDRRTRFADWVSSPENVWFAKNIVNRMWAHFLGRGLIEPVDDLRATNPPTNADLLEALERHFVSTGYDLKELIRTITASRTYQVSSQPNETNRDDEQSYSRAILKPLEAEVLLDAVCQVTGVPEKFDGMPSGYRAIELWDSGLSDYFLKVFGRPVRKSSCVCERSPDASVSQALHIMNSPEIHAKLVHDGGNVARSVALHRTDRALVDELYVEFYSRYPDAAERRRALEYLSAASDRRRAAEDLAWSMLCSIEFIFRH